MEKHDKKDVFMDAVNEVIKLCDGMVALDDGVSSDPAQKYALSRMYAEKEFRDYLKRARDTNKSALGSVSNLEGLWYCKGRIAVLSELLGISKQYFEEAAKLDKSIKL